MIKKLVFIKADVIEGPGKVFNIPKFTDDIPEEENILIVPALNTGHETTNTVVDGNYHGKKPQAQQKVNGNFIFAHKMGQDHIYVLKNKIKQDPVKR